MTKKIYLTFLIAIFILNSVFSNQGYPQTQTNDLPLQITEGWDYRWGDSPFDEQEVAVWTYELDESSEWKPLSYPAGVGDPPYRKGRKTIWFRVTLPEGNWLDPHLYIGSVGFACEVYIESKRIYSFGSVNTVGAGKYSGPRRHLIPLDSNFEGKIIFFRIFSGESDSIGLARVKLLSRNDYVESLFKNELPLIVLGFLFAGIGLLFLALFILRRKPKIYFTFGLRV